MAPKAFVQPVNDSRSTFRPDIFKGKVLFCTGGGSGICKGIVESMMAHGVDAAILGRNTERLAKAAQELSSATGQKCLPLTADVRKKETIAAAVEATLAKFGRIDFVICGAAGNFLAPISGLSENAFRTVIEIDTLGTYNTIKATLPHLRKSHGTYLHISATLHYRGTPYQAHVSAAKAAVDALSNVLAIEEGPHGIRSNVIAPGAIGDTEGADRLSLKNQINSGESDSNPFPSAGGRIGAIHDVANTAVFLFSPAASYVTGQVWAVDGGQEHLRTANIPYPRALLDPSSIQDQIKARM